MEPKYRFEKFETVTLGRIDVIDCVKKFDRGAESIFIVDDEGSYTGLALTRDSFPFGFNEPKRAALKIPVVIAENFGGGNQS